MTAAAALAFAAGVSGVLAAWEALAAVQGRAWLARIERLLAPLRADREPTPAEQRRLVLVGVATVAAAGWLVGGPVWAGLLGAGAPAAVRQALALRGRRRRAQLARGAPAAARALADAVAAGHSVAGAIAVAGRAGGVAGPAGDELRRAAAALEVGESVAATLGRLRRRARDAAWDTLTAAVLLQADAGGDLAALLRDLAARLEGARRAEEEARSLTAQARFTALLVPALPAGAAVLAELGAPGTLRSLMAAPLTGALVATSLVLQLVAVVLVRRIARP